MAPKVMGPPAGKRGLEDGGETGPAKMAKSEAIAEPETDAGEDTRPQISAPITFEPQDTTLNVVPAAGGRLLTSLSEGGMQYLVSGARASVGLCAGRHLFEVRIVEAFNSNSRGSAAPKQMVRIGVSTAEAPLILGESQDALCFDADGSYFRDGKRSQVSRARFAPDQVVGILLNLDGEGVSAQTISIFRDGQRVSDPISLPESFRGKPLFPHVNFRNVSLQVNFGPKPTAPLAFTCRMWSGAAEEDSSLAPKAPLKNGKYEVVFPVCLPDEGTFDWLDTFMEKNPEFVEISNRKIVDWGTRSALQVWKPKTASASHSNDKPAGNFGIPAMDDFSARKVIQAVTPLVPRNYVVMEVKGNLLSKERTAAVRRFAAPCFRKVAHVVIGQPSDDYKTRVHQVLLDEKQQRLEKEWRTNERQRLIKMKQKEIEKKKAKAQLEKKQKLEDEVKTEDEKKEDAAEAAKEEKVDEEREEDAEEEEEAAPPKAELTEEEKKQWHKVQVITDLTPMDLAALGDFSLPSRDEGFDEVRYCWQGEKEARAYIEDWVRRKKRTTRVEDIQPSEWFTSRLGDWQKVLQEWQQKQKDCQAKTVTAAKPKGSADGVDGGEQVDADATVGTGDATEKPEEDVLAIADVCDIGDGEPLFVKFQFEDWALTSLRFELHLLAKAFRHDVADPDRPGIQEAHLGFYYERYYKKGFNMKFYGASSLADLVELVNDSVSLSEEQLLESKFPDEPETPYDTFVKLAEDARRKRQVKISAGDDTAKLKFNAMAQPQTVNPPTKAKSQGPSSGHDKGGKGGRGGWGGKGGKGGWSGYGKGGWGGFDKGGWW